MARPPGRPPLGKQAMSGAERQRRYLDRLLQGTHAEPALKAELAAAKARIAELERQRHEAAPASRLVRARGSFRQPLNEETKLRAENARLRARTLDGETIKLRKEVEELRGERTSLKQALKRAAKERDQNEIVRSSPLLRAAARGDLKPTVFRQIVFCLHSDTRQKKTDAQLDEACGLFTELKELFRFDR